MRQALKPAGGHRGAMCTAGLLESAHGGGVGGARRCVMAPDGATDKSADVAGYASGRTVDTAVDVNEAESHRPMVTHKQRADLAHAVRLAQVAISFPDTDHHVKPI